MSTNPAFMAALAARTQLATAKTPTQNTGPLRSVNMPGSRVIAPAAAFTPPPAPEVEDLSAEAAEAEPVCRIERVLNKRRIDIYFSVKPPAQILQRLRGEGFAWHPVDKRWYHADTPANRKFLSELTGEPIEADDPPPPPPVAEEKVDASEYLPYLGHKFATYRKQVDELIRHLKIEPADLMLVAIDALHKQTFEQQ